ncbi:MAG: DUF559 domain-containing protein [bacterium]|nr:DUF559 domain-containing protein [bacterium]
MHDRGEVDRYSGRLEPQQRLDAVVLVGVLKNKKDLRLLLRKRWYRIPAAYMPKRKFTYLAFYQPASFGKCGKRIERYARVTGRNVVKRIHLLPFEPDHPRRDDMYIKLAVTNIKKLFRPVKNVIPRRINFGFTTLGRLLSAKNILELYGVPATEQMIEKSLKFYGIRPRPQYPVISGRKRYRIDLAIVCRKGIVAIECDNYKAHAGRVHRLQDRQKDFRLRRLGWLVLRLTERDVIERLNQSMERIKSAVHALGGQARRRMSVSASFKDIISR